MPLLCNLIITPVWFLAVGGGVPDAPCVVSVITPGRRDAAPYI